MKGSDKVMVELTGYQVATIYALIGRSEIGNKNESCDLYDTLEELLGVRNALPVGYNFPDRIDFVEFEKELYKAVLELETPILTEAQKKALELKEAIAKAQKQLEELEKEI